MKRFGYTKLEWSWIMQDWANSAYSLIVTTAIFPLFFKAMAESNGVTASDSTAFLGYANSLATITVGLSAPILGTMADFEGRRQPMFTLATLLGALSVLAMAFVPDHSYSWILLLILYVVSSMGAAAANIFYDASLLDVTNHQRMSQVSSMGFGMGYIGSTIPFILVIFLMKQLDGTAVVRFSFVLTAFWWLLFSVPYWKNVKQVTGKSASHQLVKDSLNRLRITLSNVRQYKNVLIFLLAYFLYIDGVGTIIKMATSIGADLGISASTLILVLLLVQIVAFPCTIIYGHLAKRWGDKRLIYVGIGTYIGICVYAYFMQTSTDFMILAFLVGSAQGGVQSLSRSLFGKLVPEGRNNEFFGLYNVFGKFSSLIGTSLLGIISQVTGNSLNGIFGLIVLFIIGGLLLWPVQVESNH
ncbi:MFS transporter [Hutsoniella sourekii]|uniref:MFS transporter n=1 Tax=Hutsoniella sourekii TaxID=87650 RepID=UPI0004825ABB|nr:MFS transporter [Hutsoniella sourekii]